MHSVPSIRQPFFIARGIAMNQPFEKFRYEIGAPTPKDFCVCVCKVSLAHVAKHEAGDFQNVGMSFQEPKSA